MVLLPLYRRFLKNFWRQQTITALLVQPSFFYRREYNKEDDANVTIERED
jgi:hypothetical protein